MGILVTVRIYIKVSIVIRVVNWKHQNKQNSQRMAVFLAGSVNFQLTYFFLALAAATQGIFLSLPYTTACSHLLPFL